MATRYNSAGTKLADINVTTTIRNRIDTAIGTIAAGRLNTWFYVPSVIIVGTTPANYYVKKEGGVYTEIRNT